MDFTRDPNPNPDHVSAANVAARDVLTMLNRLTGGTTPGREYC